MAKAATVCALDELDAGSGYGCAERIGDGAANDDGAGRWSGEKQDGGECDERAERRRDR